VRRHRSGRQPVGGAWCLVALSAFALSIAADPAAAQAVLADSRASAVAQPTPPEPDFLFGRPKGSFGIRTGWLFARTDSDLFEFVRDQLTIGRNAFNTPALAVDIGAVASNHVDVVIGFAYSRATIDSEYRRFVDNNRQPIAQQTRLQQVNLTASAKVAVLPRGREVGRLAWIPRPVSPYVGAGAGYLWYKFEQSGAFVDFVDLSVFDASLRSSRWTPGAHVFAGADIKLRRRLFLEAEARYLWAKGATGQDFVGFDRIDLSGLNLTAGVNLLF
jgi:opacity protein-like surface antigen